MNTNKSFFNLFSKLFFMVAVLVSFSQFAVPTQAALTHWVDINTVSKMNKDVYIDGSVTAPPFAGTPTLTILFENENGQITHGSNVAVTWGSNVCPGFPATSCNQIFDIYALNLTNDATKVIIVADWPGGETHTTSANIDNPGDCPASGCDLD